MFSYIRLFDGLLYPTTRYVLISDYLIRSYIRLGNIMLKPKDLQENFSFISEEFFFFTYKYYLGLFYRLI